MPNNESFWNHPIDKLEKALNLRKQIAELEQTLKELFGSTPSSMAASQAPVARESTGGRGRRGGRRKMSPAARARIAAAQRARWAKVRGTASPDAEAPAASAAPKRGRGRRKGGMSAEGRARIIAAQKARWAKVRAQNSGAAAAPAKAASTGRRKKGKISAAGLARIKAAQKLRWAKFRKANA